VVADLRLLAGRGYGEANSGGFFLRKHATAGVNAATLSERVAAELAAFSCGRLVPVEEGGDDR